MRNQAKLTLALLALATLDGNAAEHYKWVDENGSIHMADSIGQVPPQYRDKVKKVGPKRRRSSAPPSGPAVSQQRQQPAAAPQAYQPSINLSATLPADSQPGKATVPFKRAGAVVIVEAILNNQEPVNVVVDTGASMTMLTRATAAKLGLDTTKPVAMMKFHTANGGIEAPVLNLSSLTVGGLRLDNLQVVIHDWSPHADVHGLLGLNYLRHFKMDIDTDKSTLELELKKSVR